MKDIQFHKQYSKGSSPTSRRGYGPLEDTVWYPPMCRRILVNLLMDAT